MLINIQILKGGAAIGQSQFDSDNNRTLKIGRLASAQIKLEDPKVARIHAVIEFSGTDFSLIDMGSTEGTQVNGQKVHKVKLNEGDKITLGDTTLLFSTGAVAAAPPAPTPAAPAPASTPPALAFTMPARAPQPAPSFMAPPAAAPPAFASSGAPPPAASAMPQAAAPRVTPQRLRSAAVESKPHPALQPETAITAENRLLEMRLYWGEVLLGVSHYKQPKAITIGETKKTNVFISSEGLPTETFPLVRYVDDEYILTFCSHMDGELELGGDTRTLQQLRTSTLAKKDDTLSDSFRVKLPIDARGIVHWGGATMALRFVPPSEGVAGPSIKDWDLQYLNFLLISFFIHLAVVITLLVYPYDTESLRDDLFDKPDRFANLILEKPKNDEANKNLLEKIKKQVEEKKQEMEKTREEKPKPQEKELKITAKAPPKIEKTQAQKAQEVNQKFIKLMSGSAGTGSLLGGGSGGSITGTLANVIGTTGAGSASAGMAGLGIRGGGPATGGGLGTSIGLAGIGTSGRAGGGGLAYGSGVGLGKGKDRGMIDIGTPAIIGSLPPEVIKKVIDENKAQIRFCYESELQRNQNLEGRVQMKWIISATGAVSTAIVKSSDLKNANVENCIAAKIRGWRFPQPAGGGIVEVNYPFIFKAN